MQYGKKLTTESYENGVLRSTKELYEIPVNTSQMDILKDFIESLKPLTSGDCKKLELEIKINQLGQWKLIKRFQVTKD